MTVWEEACFSKPPWLLFRLLLPGQTKCSHRSNSEFSDGVLARTQFAGDTLVTIELPASGAVF